MKQSNFSRTRLLFFLNLLFISIASTVYSQQNAGPIIISKLNFVQKAQQTFIDQPSLLSFDIILGNRDKITDLSLNYRFIDADFGTVTSVTDQEITGTTPAFETNTIQITTTTEGKSALLVELKKQDQLIDSGLIQLTSNQLLFELLGTDIFCLELGNDYIEPGFKATDAVAGDVTDQVIVDDSSLDTNTLGEYLITYTLNIGEKTQILNRLVSIVNTDEDIFSINANDAGPETTILLNEFNPNFEIRGVGTVGLFINSNNSISEDLKIKTEIENTDIAEIIEISSTTTLGDQIAQMGVSVKGKIPGTTKLIATAPNGISYEHTIIVGNNSSVCFIENEKTIFVGESYQPSIDIRNDINGEVPTFTFEIPDQGILSFDEFTNTITGIAVGTQSINLNDTLNSYTKTITITVIAPEIEVNSISIDQGDILNLDIFDNDEAKLTASILPENASGKGVVWSTDSPSFLYVDAFSGYLLASTSGIVTVTATSISNPSISDQITVIIESPFESIEIIPNELNLNVREIENLTANTIVKEGLTPTIIDEWSSSNPSVASIDREGKITANKIGTTIITVSQLFDPNLTDSIVVTVGIGVNTISISPTNSNLAIGESQNLLATILPTNATNKAVNWSSSDSSVVNVTTNGRITANKVGNATITVTSIDNPTIKATTRITVTEPFIPVERIVISGATQNQLLGTGETVQLTATVFPANATNKNITWRNRNDDTTIPPRARVNATGLVTGIAQSTTNIIATSASNPTVTASIGIRVFTTPPILEGDGDYFGKPRETVSVTIQATGQETEIPGRPIQSPGPRTVRSSGVVIFESAQARDIRPGQVGYLREEVRYNGDTTTSETFTYQLPGNGFRPLRVRIVPDVNNNVSFPEQDTATISVTSNGVTRTRNLSSNTNPSFGRF